MCRFCATWRRPIKTATNFTTNRSRQPKADPKDLQETWLLLGAPKNAARPRLAPAQIKVDKFIERELDE